MENEFIIISKKVAWSAIRHYSTFAQTQETTKKTTEQTGIDSYSARAWFESQL
jgi:hypothetical protein